MIINGDSFFFGIYVETFANACQVVSDVAMWILGIFDNMGGTLNLK